jgi:hypothetical protein
VKEKGEYTYEIELHCDGNSDIVNNLPRLKFN